MTRRAAASYFCQWCATGHHDKCATDRCACRAAYHYPDLELARRMLSSQAPDLAPAILRGAFDNYLED